MECSKNQPLIRGKKEQDWLKTLQIIEMIRKI